MINLEIYKPQPTRYKKIFKEHEVSHGTVASYLGKSYSYVCNILNGTIKTPSKIKEKLQELAHQLESGKKEGATIIDLGAFKPQHSKFKKIFKAHGVSLGTVANYLGLSYPYVLNVLAGFDRMTPEVEEKLKKLVDQLEGA